MVPIAENIFWPIFHHMGASFLNFHSRKVLTRGGFDSAGVSMFRLVFDFGNNELGI